jgi:hypothetical protein
LVGFDVEDPHGKERWMDNSAFKCGRGSGPTPQKGLSDRLAMELDPRLADVWSCLFGVGIEGGQLLEQIGWFLRMAYLHGYDDALTEPRRGALFAGLGLEIPKRPGSGQRGLR